MKNHYFLLCFFSLLIISNLSPAQLKQGEFAIGGHNYDASNKVFQDLDMGYVLAGGSYSFYGGTYVIKFDSSGNEKWSRCLMGTLWGEDVIPITTILQKPNYIVLSVGANAFSYGLSVSRLNESGRLMWHRGISIDEDLATRIVEAKDGKLYFTANDNWTNSYHCAELGEIDTSGNVKWGTIIHDSINSSTSYGGASALVMAKDGGILMAGAIIDAGLIKTDTAGKVQWAKNIGITYDSANAITNTNDGGYILAGSTSMGAGGRDIYVVKIDSLYNVKWAKTIGGSGYDVASYINQTSDGGYVIAGTTSSFGAGHGDVCIVRLDASGNLKWARTIGGTGNDAGTSVQQTTDKGYAISGTTYSFGKGKGDIYFIKLDSNGNSCNAVSAAFIVGAGSTASTPIAMTQYHYFMAGSGLIDTAADTVTVLCLPAFANNTSETRNNFLVYPNPFASSSTLQFNESGKHFVEVDDITGRKLEFIQCEGRQYQLRRGGLANGIYFLKLYDENQQYIANTKIVIE
jgi:hypothetical protein